MQLTTNFLLHSSQAKSFSNKDYDVKNLNLSCHAIVDTESGK